MKRFPEKRILITGSGSGLGRALALEFGKMGWRVAVAEIIKERAQETVRLVNQAGGQGLEIICDVTKLEDLEKAAGLLKEQWGGVDILVNNAGVAAAGYMEKIPMDRWEWILNLNLKSIIHGCRTFIPIMEKQGQGHIVNIASIGAFVVFPEMSNYNVTKGATVSLSETLRIELAPKNIGVTVVCPTFFKTNLMDQFQSTDERQKIMAYGFFHRPTRALRFLLPGKTAEDIAKHIIKSVKMNRFYDIAQFQARLCWRFKRYFPELFLKMFSSVYKSGVFDKLHDHLKKLEFKI